MQYQPIIIIGAPRSGTNILRDVLTSFPGIATWPCDEINYIWRHGNVSYSSDEFTPDMAGPKVKKYIRSKFTALASKTGGRFIVEKTCANSLRVGFVDAVLPEAKYLFLLRDGRQVVPSAMKRWQGIMERPLLPYLFQKAGFVPPFDLPYYALRYLGTRLHCLYSQERRLSFWGPRFKGMDTYCREHSLAEICAMQWKKCVEQAEKDFAAMPANKVCRIQYEEFTEDPREETHKVLEFLGASAAEEELSRAVKAVRPARKNAWQEKLSPDEREKVLRIIYFLRR